MKLLLGYYMVFLSHASVGLKNSYSLLFELVRTSIRILGPCCLNFLAYTAINATRKMFVWLL